MDRLIMAGVVLVGVPATLIGYILLTELVLRPFDFRVARRIRPWLWLAPALALVIMLLVYPSLDTIRRSFMDRFSNEFIGLDNFAWFFSRNDTVDVIRNNLLWLVFLTGFAVGFGLLIAILVDRVRYESLAKSVVFMPMAISFVAASAIWKFVYDARPPNEPQRGLLNGIVTAFGGQPVDWLQQDPWNNFFLIIVGTWMQTGFCMVVLSAGLKGISTELLEAARVDGANELQVFRKIILPLLAPTMAVVATTMMIFALKAFDIVYVMTNGRFGTEVIANRMYSELFGTAQAHLGRSSAIAVVLFVAIVPIMLFNIKRFREQEAQR
jgi:alpha-glucoside transport system permease protein